ncbi:RNA-processing [Hyphodiscus hymeniophilus]|uniref:RNA-processing n=1 Tax=Hyphodiscus hymeniophilus TaxID=353542 RepID=A0A9P6VL96_9HELO|nr:RNA-processing [Hyphodiscus hymeniophilus]
MAKEARAESTPRIPKLPRLSSSQRIQKRPLLHPPIAPPRAGSSVQKIVYVSSSSPFIAVVKRVRKLLSHVEARAAGPITFAARNQHDILRQIEDGVNPRGKGGKGAREEEVIMKATGKAIEKLLALALHFQCQDDVKVVLRTGSVGAVDDIVNKEGADEEEEGSQDGILWSILHMCPMRLWNNYGWFKADEPVEINNVLQKGRLPMRLQPT